MRIAIYYDNRFGRNDGPPLYYYNQLKKIKGAEVLHLIPEGDNRNFGTFDYHFWVDWGEDGLPVDRFWTPQDDGTRIYVVSDTHIDEKGRAYRFKKAHQFDYVFFNQKRAMPDFVNWNLGRRMDSRVKEWHWLPHAAEPQAYPRYNIIKKYDVAFIGHLQEKVNHNNMTRVEALDKLFKAFPNFYFGVRNPAFPDKNIFEHAAHEFAKSRIVFNISIVDDINMRVFEAMATGSMLLTNKIPTLDKLFTDGVHLVTYTSYNEMIDKVHYYLEHEEEREKIARQGYEEVIAKHTYQHRIKTIFSKIGETVEFIS